MSERIYNYFEDLAVDESILDEEALKQPVQHMKYIELYAEKDEEVNEQKRKIKVEEANLKELAGKLYIKYKQGNKEKKPTEKEIESLIVQDEEYKTESNNIFNMLSQLNRLIKQSLILEGAVKSFQQRKNGIETAKDLWIMGFNSKLKQKSMQERLQDKLNNKKEEEE